MTEHSYQLQSASIEKPIQSVPVEFFTHQEMIVFASKRARVKIEDGKRAILIRWATPTRPSLARVMFFNGNFATIKKAKVVSVEVDSIKMDTPNDK